MALSGEGLYGEGVGLSAEWCGVCAVTAECCARNGTGVG